jgi:glycosyltransferase involved in cell wall biosynthesis
VISSRARIRVTDEEASVLVTSEGAPLPGDGLLPLIIAIHLHPEGNTGVHTHVRELRRYLGGLGVDAPVVTPFSWGRLLTYPVFGLRRTLINPVSREAGVAWYERSHAQFLRRALARHLADGRDCVVYAQGPLEASAALRARRGPNQRVVMAVHFRVSRADEYADGREIPYGGRVYGAIRRLEREVIPQVDALVYVSTWGREALLDWLPEAAGVPSTVIGNFVTPWRPRKVHEPVADLVTTGRLEPAKNHLFLLHVPIRDQLLAETRSLGLEGQVAFRGFRTDIRDFLPHYRAYVHASFSESLPLSIIEAMDAGLPIVAGNSGGIPEICDDGVEARFWPLDDPVESARALLELLTDQPTRAAMGRAAKERFRKDFDADAVAPRLRSFLSDAPGTP